MERATVDSASPLSVVLDSGDNSAPSCALASYTPVVGDRVVVVKLGSQLLILGKVT